MEVPDELLQFLSPAKKTPNQPKKNHAIPLERSAEGAFFRSFWVTYLTYRALYLHFQRDIQKRHRYGVAKSATIHVPLANNCVDFEAFGNFFIVFGYVVLQHA